jgi:hypothetical protein
LAALTSTFSTTMSVTSTATLHIISTSIVLSTSSITYTKTPPPNLTPDATIIPFFPGPTTSTSTWRTHPAYIPAGSSNSTIEAPFFTQPAPLPFRVTGLKKLQYEDGTSTIWFTETVYIRGNSSSLTSPSSSAPPLAPPAPSTTTRQTYSGRSTATTLTTSAGSTTNTSGARAGP